jgi:hypothetical protein
LGFSREEIDTFNRRRVSLRVFDPYTKQTTRTASHTLG